MERKMSGMFSVVIPAFNEEEVIEHTYHWLKSVIYSTVRPYELLF
ncbi:hypothetical protein [Fictibacillus sp. KU28468]|nr:hypothetical protein [Fictibacillus sp. KU28468]UZJ77847.1 hypothetical protein OKX00_17005 [Fictibacillus sp. KU28468]